MKYLVSFSDEQEFQLDPIRFVEQLRTAWPSADLREISDLQDPYLLEWVLPIGDRIDGALHRSLTTISLEGNLEDCAAFAIWYRTLVPAEYGLLFFDQGYHAHVYLQPETTEQAIVDAFALE